ncbi:MAG TPA: oligosaccharide flippase family protein [Chthoniobacterales bacterium]
MINSIRQKIAAKLGKSSARGKSLGMFFATSLFSRGITVVCQLVQVPLVLHAFGTEGFGLWVTLTGFLQLLVFTDLGIGASAQNQMAEALAQKNFDLARQLFSSALVTLLGIGCLLAALLLPLVWFLDLNSIFKLSQENIRLAAPGAVAAAIFGFCSGFPMALAQRLAQSRQLGWKINLILAYTAIATLAVIFVTTRLHWNLAMVMFASSLCPVLGNGLFMASMLGNLGWFNVRLFQANKHHVQSLLKVGAYFGVQQITSTILFSAPTVIISTMMGAAAVTPFNLAQRLYNLFNIIQSAIMVPLWPAYSEAHAKGEIDWIQKTLGRSLLASIGLSLLPMAIATVFAQSILRLWVGQNAVLPDWTLILLIFAWNAVLFLQQPFGYLLAGVSEVKQTTLYSVLSTIACLGLMLWLGRSHGQAGVVVGMIVGFLPFSGIGSVIQTFKYLDRAKRNKASFKESSPVEAPTT